MSASSDLPQVAGPLFEAVQLAQTFPDSKTFVDSVPKRSPKSILELYVVLKDEAGFDLKAFVLEHFNLPKPFEADAELALDSSSLEAYIETLWPRLRRSPEDIREFDTLIRLERPYIVPGGRFGEIYYWDSYFTFLGLAETGQLEQIDQMVQNFADLQTRLNLIPNGNRQYFATRSQPPFLALMLRLLWAKKYRHLDKKVGLEFLNRYVGVLEQERDFWTLPHRLSVSASGHLLNHYWDDVATPREEAYAEDVELAENAADPELLYRHIRAGAESGWDFSSRWLREGQDLSTIHTTDILPIDLNCLLYVLEETLADFHNKLGDTQAQTRYAADAETRKAAIQDVFWDEAEGFYFDFDTETNERTDVFSLAAALPLFVGIATQSQAERVREHLMTRFLKAGGLVTTLNETGQQWDAPNGWAPLQWLAIEGLRNYGFEDDAQQIATRWLKMIRARFDTDKKLLEKYDVVNLDAQPGGGEYEVQEGFGWTNGVTLALLKRYGDA